MRALNTVAGGLAMRAPVARHASELPAVSPGEEVAFRYTGGLGRGDDLPPAKQSEQWTVPARPPSPPVARRRREQGDSERKLLSGYTGLTAKKKGGRNERKARGTGDRGGIPKKGKGVPDAEVSDGRGGHV